VPPSITPRAQLARALRRTSNLVVLPGMIGTFWITVTSQGTDNPHTCGVRIVCLQRPSVSRIKPGIEKKLREQLSTDYREKRSKQDVPHFCKLRRFYMIRGGLCKLYGRRAATL
jgi:hypothetical protein